MQRLFCLLLICLPGMGWAQKTTCCAPNQPGAIAHEMFSALGADADFRAKHENPLPFAYTLVQGERITYPVQDGTPANAILFKAKKPSRQYLFVIHEWWGLNDYIAQEAEKIFNDLNGEVNVLALDLYDGQIATTREDAAKYMQSVKSERATAIVQGALTFAGKKAKVATIGYCFGGGWSLQSALLAGKQAVGCIIYYGMPEKDLERLKTLRAEVLGIFAAKEQWISPAIVKEFEQNLKTLNKKADIRSFDAEHAFANPSNPRYDAKAAGEAYNLSLDFLKRVFGR